MARAGEKMSEEYRQKIGDGVARGRRKPVGLSPVPELPGHVYVLWSDGEVETREVER